MLHPRLVLSPQAVQPSHPVLQVREPCAWPCTAHICGGEIDITTDSCAPASCSGTRTQVLWSVAGGDPRGFRQRASGRRELLPGVEAAGKTGRGGAGPGSRRPIPPLAPEEEEEEEEAWARGRAAALRAVLTLPADIMLQFLVSGAGPGSSSPRGPLCPAEPAARTG